MASGGRKSAWRDGDQWLAECCDSEEESSAPLDSPSPLPPPRLPPLYLILFGNKEKERERLSYRWLDLILEEHNYQRIEPFFPAQDSVPPAGAAEMMLRANNGGCRRTSQWELPTCKTRGAKSTIGSASHVSNGVSKLGVSRPAHYNSSLKKSFVVTWRRHFLLSPSILRILHSVLLVFWGLYIIVYLQAT